MLVLDILEFGNSFNITTQPPHNRPDSRKGHVGLMCDFKHGAGYFPTKGKTFRLLISARASSPNKHLEKSNSELLVNVFESSSTTNWSCDFGGRVGSVPGSSHGGVGDAVISDNDNDYGNDNDNDYGNDNDDDYGNDNDNDNHSDVHSDSDGDGDNYSDSDNDYGKDNDNDKNNDSDSDSEGDGDRHSDSDNDLSFHIS
ncbi:hypothetical protein Trydic_g22910 [Trypoxylus dichotomus]